MKTSVRTLVLGVVWLLMGANASAIDYQSLHGPVAGYVISPQNSLSAVSSNRGFEDVEKSVMDLQQTYGNDLRAIGAESYEGGMTTYVTNFYLADKSGSLKRIATVVGSTMGGDEFASSQPGIVTFSKVD
ncbi:MAG: hypothetical protein AB7T49_10890 [Oligoflexales bacterium]